MRIHREKYVRHATYAILSVLLGVLGSAPTFSQEEREIPSQKVRDNTVFTVDTGFLFVNGRYISPPYHIQARNSRVQVNKVLLNRSLLGKHRGSSRSRKKSAARRYGTIASHYLVQQLENNSVVVLFANQPPVVLEDSYTGIELLHLLCDSKKRQEVDFANVDWPLPRFDTATWNRWARTFAPSNALVNRVKNEIKEFETTEAANIAQVKAVHRFDAVSYPLSVLAMVLTVLAFGHLLSYRPQLIEPDESRTRELTAAETRVVLVSLALICVLSILDVVWTLLASSAGAMHELNPLGSRLIQNPQMLVAFKLTATAISVGLLYALRHHAVARRAAWWGCLVLTLLMVRWLVFSSMFVA